jgi:hypothetical protein
LKIVNRVNILPTGKIRTQVRLSSLLLPLRQAGKVLAVGITDQPRSPEGCQELVRT